MKKIKVLMLYGNSYSSCGMDSLSENISMINSDISVDFVKNPLIALEKIKKYDLLIMGLIWSYNESKSIPQIQNFKFSERYLVDVGIILYKVIQDTTSIKTIVYDTVLCSEEFCKKNTIPFLRMPELAKTIVEEIISIFKKEVV